MDWQRFFCLVNQKCGNQRYGQALSNTIHDLFPYFWDSIQGTDADCFFNNANITRCLERFASYLQDLTDNPPVKRSNNG